MKRSVDSARSSIRSRPLVLEAADEYLQRALELRDEVLSGVAGLGLVGHRREGGLELLGDRREHLDVPVRTGILSGADLRDSFGHFPLSGLVRGLTQHDPQDGFDRQVCLRSDLENV